MSIKETAEQTEGADGLLNGDAKTQRVPVSVLLVVLPNIVPSEGDTSKREFINVLAYPYGIISLATYLKRFSAGDPHIAILDLNLYLAADHAEILRQRLVEMQPNIVGISFMFEFTYRYVFPLTQVIKRHGEEILIVMGGASATASCAEIFADQPHLDAICYGEGELAMRRLIESESFRQELQKDPWVTRESLAAGRPARTVYLEQLNDVVALDFSLVETGRYNMRETFSPYCLDGNTVRMYPIFTSRGCPFKCVFCTIHSFIGRNIRYSDVDAVIAHVDHLVNHYGMNLLGIFDDQLLMDQSRAKELFRRLIPYKLRIEMPNGSTVSFVDEELASLMSQAGVVTIFLAIESGSDYVLRKIIKKPINLKKVKPVIDVLHKYGIFVQAFFINGFPGEREEDRQQTVQFIKEMGIDWSCFNFASPYRGTELYDLCHSNGWINPQYAKLGDVESRIYIIQAPGIDHTTLAEENYLINLDVNFVNNHNLMTGNYAVAANCFKEVLHRYPGHVFALWFLARSLIGMKQDPERVASLESEYFSIVANHAKWREYASHFGLPTERGLL